MELPALDAPITPDKQPDPVLAYVSSPIAPGEWIDTPDVMHHYTGARMPSHYWGQADIWFGRDAALMRSVF